MRYFLQYLFYSLTGVSPVLSQPVGTWQEHLSYASCQDLGASSGRIAAATPYSCFVVSSKDGAIQRLNRISGLAETGVQALFYTPNGTLVIGYRNSNIDLVLPQKIQNLNALQLKPMQGDKTIWQISGNDEQCLLATGFGIVVVNLLKQEIGDTWILGNGGAQVKVYATEKTATHYYAATEEGLKLAPANGFNLSDYRNWELVSGTAGLPAGVSQMVAAINDTVFVQVGNALYIRENTGYRLLYTDTAHWKKVSVSERKILITQQGGGEGAVVSLLPDGTVTEIIRDPLISIPLKAIASEGKIWIADSVHGLLERSAAGFVAIQPNSPAAPGSGDIIADKGAWWMATGDQLSRFAEGEWKWYNGNGNPLPDGFVRPGPLLQESSGILWAGSAGAGLLRKEGDQFSLLTKELLEPAVDDPAAYRVSGLAMDEERNLWIANDGAKKGLVVRYPNGQRRSFEIPFFLPSYALSRLLVDENGQVWLFTPGKNGLLCFNHGGSIDNTGDDQWKLFRYGKGNGNLPSNNVLCLVRDAFGFIWIGTDDGIGVIQCGGQVFSGQGCEAVLPVVQTDQFAGYLFKGEEVQAMAVDGANRKWVGTKNGAWLVSSGGEKTLKRFTTLNSPLPDNDIRSIAIDHTDGMVLFSTASGLYTYKGDATAGGSTNNNVIVYPNPVPPGYSGQIAIRGLVKEAIAKITELSGRLVYEGRALGGQLIWNGKDLNGRPISTGVYLVWITDESRREKTVAKIVFIQR